MQVPYVYDHDHDGPGWGGVNINGQKERGQNTAQKTKRLRYTNFTKATKVGMNPGAPGR